MFYKATVYQTVLANLHLWNYCCLTIFVCNVQILRVKLTACIIVLQTCTCNTSALIVYTHSSPQVT